MVRTNLSRSARFWLLLITILAWIEGTAIALAVFIVASVGSFVDWRKEVEFIN
jgi:hypothetical protein